MVLKVTAHEIYSYLEQIFNNLLILSNYLLHFKKLTIVILRKHGGNQDYISPKSYELINLLNTLDKIMETILPTTMSYIVMIHNLFSLIHFRSWRRLYIKTAIYNILEKIHVAWNKNKITSLLMIIVSTTYLIISYKRLLHNLNNRKIDHKVV